MYALSLISRAIIAHPLPMRKVQSHPDAPDSTANSPRRRLNGTLRRRVPHPPPRALVTDCLLVIEWKMERGNRPHQQQRERRSVRGRPRGWRGGWRGWRLRTRSWRLSVRVDCFRRRHGDRKHGRRTRPGAPRRPEPSSGGFGGARTLRSGARMLRDRLRGADRERCFADTRRSVVTAGVRTAGFEQTPTAAGRRFRPRCFRPRVSRQHPRRPARVHFGAAPPIEYPVRYAVRHRLRIQPNRSR